MIRPLLEGALVKELVKVGISEPKRFYRPALEARDAMDEKMQRELEKVRQHLVKNFNLDLDPKSQGRGIRDLFEWNIYSNGLRGRYVIREEPYNPDFSMEGVNAAIISGRYAEEFDIAQAESEMTNGVSDIMIASAIDNGRFSVPLAEVFTRDYDIKGIKAVKKRKGSIEDFTREVAKLFRRN